MDLTQLAYFVAVAEEESFTRGAEREHVVQSTASAAVARLETELGQPVFARVGHRIELTLAGRTLLPRARRMLQQRQELKAELDAVAEGDTGIVTLGTPLSTGDFPLASVLSAFHRGFPRVSLRVATCVEAVPATMERVRAGSLDLALLPTPPAPLEGVRTAPIGRLRLALVTARDWTGQQPLDFASLVGERFIDFAPGWPSRDRADSLFADRGLTRDVAIEVADVSLALDLVAGGLGIAFLPERLTTGRTDVTTITVHDTSVERGLALARPDRVLPAAAEALHTALLRARVAT